MKLLWLFMILSANGMTLILKPKCPPLVCRRYCESGMRMDKLGCLNCQCVDPCEDYYCPEGTKCQHLALICFEAPCYKSAICVPLVAPICPPFICNMFCKSGLRVDQFGCTLCQCVDPCESRNCPENEFCVEETEDCKYQFCYKSSKCKKCPIPKCDFFCNSGFKVSSKGCPYCQCKNPCENYKCPTQFQCKPRSIWCLVEPCYLIPSCEPLYNVSLNPDLNSNFYSKSRSV